MIELKNITKKYQNLYAVENISICFEPGAITGIIGMSGAGKTTLMKIISLLETPDEGDVLYHGNSLRALSNQDLAPFRRKIGIVFQGYQLLDQQDVFHNIALPLKLAKWKKEEIRHRVEELLVLVGLKEKKHNYPSQLSGGQKQRIAIARALASRPEILLLDEFSSALDPITSRQLIKLIKEIQQKTNVTVIFISHDLYLAKVLADRLVVINEGQIIESGAKEEVIHHPKHPITKLLFLEEEGFYGLD